MTEPADKSQDDGDESDGGSRGPLLALGIVVVLVLAGLWLTHILGSAASTQDCMAAGRTNCAPVHTAN